MFFAGACADWQNCRARSHVRVAGGPGCCPDLSPYHRSIQNVRDILNYFEVNDYFDLILSQEDVTFKKPSPEGFLKAIELAKVSINDVLIFEDSDVGIEAAKLSGAKFVRVYGYN